MSAKVGKALAKGKANKNLPSLAGDNSLDGLKPGINKHDKSRFQKKCKMRS
jgi:hypothetical protein